MKLELRAWGGKGGAKRTSRGGPVWTAVGFPRQSRCCGRVRAIYRRFAYTGAWAAERVIGAPKAVLKHAHSKRWRDF